MPSIAKAEITLDMADLKANIKEFPKHFNDDVAVVFDLNAAVAEAWMKANAPWTDNTGAARSGLTAIADSQGSLHNMLLSYSVSYGIWLEIANSGRFQILGPAQRVIASKIMQDLKGILDGRPISVSPPTESIPPIARKTARKGTSRKSGNRSNRKKYGQRQRP